MNPLLLPFKRFRLRVEVFAPQDGRDVNPHPLSKFTIVKSDEVPLLGLTLRELCPEIVKRFKSMYSSQLLFNIDRSQDSSGYDLYLDDRVGDIFEDNDVLRIIQGNTFRASVEPHRARSASLQPTDLLGAGYLTGQKRSMEYPTIHPYSQPEKRRRTANHDANHPISSSERDLDAREGGLLGESLQHATVVQDSQPLSAGHGQPSRDRHAGQSSLPVLEVSETIRKIDGSYKDVNSPNVVAKAAAQIQHALSPISVGSSKSGALTSGSDIRPHNGRASSGSNRIFVPYDEHNDADRPKSASTAVTTPPSAGPQLGPSFSTLENNNLKRPNPEAAQGRESNVKVPRMAPRKNVYSDIETEPARPSVKPARPINKKVSLKPKQPSSPAGVSKANALLQKEVSSGHSSPHPRRNDVVHEKDIDQDEQNQSREEQRRMDQGHQKTLKLAREEAEAQSGLTAKAAEHELQVATESRKAKLEESARNAARKRAEEDEARAASEAAEKARRKEREEADAKAVAESEAKAERERQSQLRLKQEINKQRAEARKANLTSKSTLHNHQSVKSPSTSSPIRPKSLLAKALAANEHDKASMVNSRTPPILPNSTTPKSAPVTRISSSTPLIPRGRPSGFPPAAMLSSQAVGSSSPAEPSPRSRVQTPATNRKVSFADSQQKSRSGRKSTTPSSSLTQTTLVAPRLSFTGTKSTPKRNKNGTVLSGLESSESHKGKAKVVESVPKPPVEVIVISDTESSIGGDTDLGSLGYNEDDFRGVGEPGPAYPKSLFRLSTRNPKPKVGDMSHNEDANLTRQTPSEYPTIIKVENGSSPEPFLFPSAKSSPKILRDGPSPRGLRSHVRSYSPIQPPGTEAGDADLHAGSRPQGISPAKDATALLTDLVSGKSGKPSNAIEEDEMSEDDVSRNGRRYDTEEGEEAETSEDDQAMADEEEAEGETSEDEESDDDETSDEDESEEDLREEGHTTQNELDEQLIQAHQPITAGKKRLDMPSLRRMTKEILRTKDIDLIAARERGVAKLQKQESNTGRASEITEAEDDSTELWSSSSEDDEDETKAENKLETSVGIDTVRGTLESSRSVSELLGSEDDEDLRKDLEPKMNGRIGVSSQRMADARSPKTKSSPRKAILPGDTVVGFAKLNETFKVKERSNKRSGQR